MAVQLSNPTVLVNNVQVAVKPNSVVYDEGLGEQTIRAASTGGGSVEQVYSRNVETEFGMVKFEMASTIDNIKLQREWKVAQNQNLVQVFGRTADGDVSRTFTQAAVLNAIEVPLGSDADIAIEFKSNPAT
jgi:hypothetical protein